MRDWSRELPGWHYREAAKRRPKSKALDFLFFSGPVVLRVILLPFVITGFAFCCGLHKGGKK